MLYRILTEDKNRLAVEDIVAFRFGGFTVIEATGFWLGAKESSLIIEIDTTKEGVVREVARRIKAVNGQESVLVQSFEVDSKLI